MAIALTYSARAYSTADVTRALDAFIAGLATGALFTDISALASVASAIWADQRDGMLAEWLDDALTRCVSDRRLAYESPSAMPNAPDGAFVYRVR